MNPVNQVTQQLQQAGSNVLNAPTQAAQNVATFQPSSQNPVMAAAQSTGNLAKNTLGNPDIWANAAGSAGLMALLNPLAQKAGSAGLQALEKGGGDPDATIGSSGTLSPDDLSQLRSQSMGGQPVDIGSVFQKIQARTPLTTADVDTLVNHPDIQEAIGQLSQTSGVQPVMNALQQGQWRGVLTAAQPYLEKMGSALTPLLKTSTGTNLLQ